MEPSGVVRGPGDVKTISGDASVTRLGGRRCDAYRITVVQRSWCFQCGRRRYGENLVFNLFGRFRLTRDVAIARRLVGWL